MSRSPAVSVVLPARDAAPFLARAVESVLGQSLGDLELLVVDDGSTDGTPEAARRAAGADPRLRLVTQRRLGLVAALNRGCAEARGGYIARQDADDVSLPERLELQIRHLESHPATAVLGTAMRYAGESGPLPGVLRHPVSPAKVRAALGEYCCIAHPTVVMRRAAWSEAGGYRLPDAEDYDLWLRIAERHDLDNLPDPLALYRVHEGQVSFADLPRRLLATLFAREAARRRAAGAPDPAAGRGPIERGDLTGLGMTAEAIDAAIVDACVGRGDLLLRLGLAAQAWSAACEMDRLGLGGPGGRRLRAEASWLKAKVRLRAGRLPSGLGYLLRALRDRPAFAANLWRALPRRGGVAGDAGPGTAGA